MIELQGLGSRERVGALFALPPVTKSGTRFPNTVLSPSKNTQVMREGEGVYFWFICRKCRELLGNGEFCKY